MCFLRSFHPTIENRNPKPVLSNVEVSKMGRHLRYRSHIRLRRGGESEAQQTARVPRIGFLSPFSPSSTALWRQAFLQGLRDLGWIEGKNISIEYRYAEGKSDRLPDLAADLVRLKVNIIVASVNSDALVAKKATRITPIVMASSGDPVAIGLVESLARPGGNVTGLSQMAPEMAGKRLELLNEIVPKLSSVAVLWNPQGTTSTLNWNEIQTPSTASGSPASFA